MAMPFPQEVPFRPVSFRDWSGAEIVEAIAHAAPGGEVASFIALNAHTVYLAEQDEEFADVLRAGRLFCDGFGVHLLAVAQGLPRPVHRNTPTDFMWEVFARLHESAKTVYLLGDEPGVAEQFARVLQSRFPGLVVGHQHGYFRAGEEAEIISAINSSGAHLLCVGLGQPRQEKWVHERRGELQCAAAFTLAPAWRLPWAQGVAARNGRRTTGSSGSSASCTNPGECSRVIFVEIPWLICRALSYRGRGSG